jgi:hypothetical protein
LLPPEVEIEKCRGDARVLVISLANIGDGDRCEKRFPRPRYSWTEEYTSLSFEPFLILNRVEKPVTSTNLTLRYDIMLLCIMVERR